MTPSNLLRAACADVADINRWCQFFSAVDGFGYECDIFDRAAARRCLLGAASRLAKSWGSSSWVEAALNFAATTGTCLDSINDGSPGAVPESIRHNPTLTHAYTIGTCMHVADVMDDIDDYRGGA